MPEISVKDQINKLVEIQKIDSEIYVLKKDLEEKPAVIAELEQIFEGKKAHLKELEEKLKSIQLARKEKELELKTKEEEIGKANAQLSQIKTNKEYTAKINEIENIKADKSIFEEKILMSFDESDSVSKEIEKEKEHLAGEEKIYLEKKAECDGDVKEIKDRIKVLETQRTQLIPEVDKSFFARYEKILRHKEGLAIAPVQGGACGGCFMNLTNQMVNALKMNDQLVECEMCSRILYIED